MRVGKKAATTAKRQQVQAAEAARAPPAMADEHEVMSEVTLPEIGSDDQFVEVVKALSM